MGCRTADTPVLYKTKSKRQLASLKTLNKECPRDVLRYDNCSSHEYGDVMGEIEIHPMISRSKVERGMLGNHLVIIWSDLLSSS